MKIESFEKLFHVLLSDIYYAEKSLVDCLPDISKKAQSKELKEAMHHHLKETKEQVHRLERVFKLLGTTPLNISWSNTFSLLMERGQKILEDNESGAVADAAIIAALQRVEHFEIATYGTLIEFADAMDLTEVKALLKESIKEEGAADAALTKVARGGLFKAGVNEAAIK